MPFDDIIESRNKYGVYDDDLDALTAALNGSPNQPPPSGRRDLADVPAPAETLEDILREARDSRRKYGA